MPELTDLVEKLRKKADRSADNEELKKEETELRHHEEELKHKTDRAENHAGRSVSGVSGQTDSTGAADTISSASDDPSVSDSAGSFRSEKERSRFSEIRAVLSRNHITRGVSPEKLRVILEELGPTYVKLGQIMSMHSDILPAAYCEELMKLNSDVAPMPFSDVEDVLRESLGIDWHDYFSWIDEKPLGSASIAQVHRASLLRNGADVVIKVQRKGVYYTMERDIRLLRRVVKLLPPVGDLKNLVDLGMVLDELWSVAQDEMDFTKEAANMLEFARDNRDIRYVTTPTLYADCCTREVLVMEYIDGCAIDDVETLKAGGYDLDEIGTKYVNNFIKQVMDDGFFHADPHPGNVKIRGGKIVWIDMGMMGRLTDRDRRIMVKGVEGIALRDVTIVKNAVLDLCTYEKRPNDDRLYDDLKNFISRYGSISMGNVNIAEAVQAIMDIMKENGLKMPHGMTMLCRGLAHVQGVLTKISPDISMLQIASSRIQEEFLENLNWRDELERNARMLFRTWNKGTELPVLLNESLKEYLAGRSKANILLDVAPRTRNVINSAVRNLVIGICIAALLIASSIVCMTDMEPKIMGLPFLGFAGYLFALLSSAFLVIRYIYNKFKGKY